MFIVSLAFLDTVMIKLWIHAIFYKKSSVIISWEFCLPGSKAM
jgi:hypothetical protein